MFYVSRFKDIEKREYECEVVTPMFLGGADPKKAELRVPSIKGALRFWWRALYDDGNVAQMAAEEARIFGSTDNKAVITLKVESKNVQPVLKDLPLGMMAPVEGKTYKTSIVNYLAYGLFEYDKKTRQNTYNKSHIPSSSVFKIYATFPRRAADDFNSALRALIDYGGLGARSRNGFGSLHCAAAKPLVPPNHKELKAFPSFSKEARLFNKFREHQKWEDALSEIGNIYRTARLKLERRHTWEKRKFIAMPIEAQRENIPQAIRQGRHAKPYFLHVNKTPAAKYQGQILFLPYLYKASPNDEADRLAEYLEVCQKMNAEIEKSIGGAK